MERMNRYTIFIANIPEGTVKKELESKFSKYGNIDKISLKETCAFIEYTNKYDARDAYQRMDRKEYKGKRLIVLYKYYHTDEENTKRRGTSSHHKKSLVWDACFNCGKEGHWARECYENEKRKKSIKDDAECYKCKEKGHFARECTSSNKENSKVRSIDSQPKYKSSSRTSEKGRDMQRDGKNDTKHLSSVKYLQDRNKRGANH